MNTMKTRRLGALALALLLCFARSAAAAEGDPTTSSTATVEFEEGNGPTDPVDPENPENPDPGPDPGVEGSLVIVKVSPLSFGRVGIQADRQLVPLALEDENGPLQPNIQIADIRGAGTGWSLRAHVEPFTYTGMPGENNGDALIGSESLPGANIIFYGARFNSTAPADQTPRALRATVSTDNTEAKIITAEAGTGAGLWVARWYPGTDGGTRDDGDVEDGVYIALEIPAGVGITGGHQSTITWILSNTP